jgi:hypothetical protein
MCSSRKYCEKWPSLYRHFSVFRKVRTTQHYFFHWTWWTGNVQLLLLCSCPEGMSHLKTILRFTIYIYIFFFKFWWCAIWVQKCNVNVKLTCVLIILDVWWNVTCATYHIFFSLFMNFVILIMKRFRWYIYMQHFCPILCFYHRSDWKHHGHYDIWCVLLQICTVPTTVKVILKYFSKCFGCDMNSYFWLFL